MIDVDNLKKNVELFIDTALRLQLELLVEEFNFGVPPMAIFVEAP